MYKLYAKGFRGADHIPLLENAQTITGLALAAPTQQPEIAARTNIKERL